MANRKRPTPKRPPAARPAGATAPAAPAAKGRSPRPWIIGGGVAVIVVLAAIIAVAAGGGDDDKDTSRDTSPGTSAAIVLPSLPGDNAGEDGAAPTAGPPSGSAAPAEFQEVTVTGDALERLPKSGDDPEIGNQAPALSGFGFDGSPVEVTPGDGRPTLVVFLAHWCPHCNREVPRLVEWNDAGEVPADLRIVGVSTGADDAAPNWPPSEWIADENWPWPVMADTEDQVAAAAYGLPGYPYFVLIGADGTVLDRQSGEVPIDTLEDVLAANGIQ